MPQAQRSATARTIARALSIHFGSISSTAAYGCAGALRGVDCGREEELRLGGAGMSRRYRVKHLMRGLANVRGR